MKKILIVTDAVNGCIYCSWMDAKLAIRSGISEDEVRNMLKLEFHTDASESELNALLFAQHYAETNRHPDPYFNTWGAVLSRFRGNPAPDSNVIFELIYALLNFIIIVPFVILRKLDRKAIEPV